MEVLNITVAFNTSNYYFLPLIVFIIFHAGAHFYNIIAYHLHIICIATFI